MTSTTSAEACIEMTPPNRRRTVPINVGGVVIGGAAAISVQTMTKTQTEDVGATLAQIERAAAAGADIVRVTCDTPEAGRARHEIVRRLGGCGGRRRVT